MAFKFYLPYHLHETNDVARAVAELCNFIDVILRLVHFSRPLFWCLENYSSEVWSGGGGFCRFLKADETSVSNCQMENEIISLRMFVYVITAADEERLSRFRWLILMCVHFPTQIPLFQFCSAQYKNTCICKSIAFWLHGCNYCIFTVVERLV